MLRDNFPRSDTRSLDVSMKLFCLRNPPIGVEVIVSAQCSNIRLYDMKNKYIVD